MTLRRRLARRFERTVLGMVMSIIAFVIERRVLTAIRGTDRGPPQPAHEGGFATGGAGDRRSRRAPRADA